MLFNSIDFAVFLPLVFLGYWLIGPGRIRGQNAFLILAGCVFYGWWDWRYLGLLLFTSGVDFLVALGLQREQATARRKLLLGISLAANLGLLGFFKYCDFFITAFNDGFTLLGRPLGLRTLGIILPVGISFYTFQSLSYTIDVYRRQLPATRDPLVFFAFVSFFPQLLAGPIERARNMVKQFENPRTFDLAHAQDGLRQILWGLFKKVVVADNCGFLVDPAYDDPTGHNGATLVLATIFFSFQIYCDFSGYSDMALGCARLFGFTLMRNFAYPYFSRDMGEYWRRWHMSLNTWFRDYLYIPLGGSRGGKWMVLRNTIIIFLVSGFWHGANWTFIAWGAINAAFFIPLILTGANRRFTGPIAEGRILPTRDELLRMLVTFALATFTRVFFRAENMTDAMEVFKKVFSASLFSPPQFTHVRDLVFSVSGILIMLVIEWINRDRQHGLQLDGRATRPVRYTLYYGLIALMILMAPLGGGEFIYFQF
ncbi:MAG: MBOAT family protein [Bacteroidetes bacterium]|nr:MBOAT family protein [Bacteroidota bacterium]MBX7128985.1 MBOAT family protein [Flavobacteriales bacterium]MCC6655503.1 MBOAT family protein [Flavobacteriales bacterium]HMU12688.1 MBOAT family O-acyltransferase [Flavobacteriales bacterium]HMW97042.1 MBOAT family O-acyltransferase [Flavobacteriales bacterium]